MASRTKLANLQYNSPIRLYSDSNIKEVLNKQSQVLSSGAVGIDFHKLSKPGNLANSEVLKMVELQENVQRPGFKRVAWPPPPEQREGSLTPVRTEVEPIHQTALQTQVVPFHQQSNPSFHGRQPHHFQQTPPQATHPLQFQSSAPSTQLQQNKGFQLTERLGPKGIVTLLPTAPVRQESALVYASQPVTGVAMGGNRMRGDDKWPPESVRQQSKAENAARIALAKGPVFRPKRPNKDYSAFFAQHALNSTYPGYRAPPGTQHYIEEGTSNL